jgi:hypothetical protein
LRLHEKRQNTRSRFAKFQRAAMIPHFDHGKPEAVVRSRLLDNGNGLTMHIRARPTGFSKDNPAP